MGHTTVRDTKRINRTGCGLAWGGPGAEIAKLEWTNRRWAYHVFSTLHQLLANDLACEVFPSLDMDGLFDDGVCPAT
jgi:hypothetical protein